MSKNKWYEFNFNSKVKNGNPNDKVYYEATHIENSSKIIGQDNSDYLVHNNCYIRFLTNYKKYSVLCYTNPNQTKSLLPPEVYSEWMLLCQKNGCVPLEHIIFYSEKDKNYFKLSCNNFNYNITYAALCCFRWAENQPTLPWTVVNILRINPKINFFQALHYAMLTYVNNYGHNFIPLATMRGNYGQFPLQQTSLIHSIGMYHFFLGKESFASKEENQNNCYLAIEKQIKALGFTPKDYSAGPVALFDVQQKENILDERWAKFYNPTFQKDKSVKYFNREFKR